MGPLLPLIGNNQAELAELCERFGVERLELFGSATGTNFQPETSDLDFIVRMRDARQTGVARRFCGFAEALEELFGRRVDLLTEAMIRNPIFRAEVETSRRLLVG